MVNGLLLPSGQGRLKGNGASLEHPQGDCHHHHAPSPGAPVGSVCDNTVVLRVVNASDGRVENDVCALCQGGQNLAVSVLRGGGVGGRGLKKEGWGVGEGV